LDEGAKHSLGQRPISISETVRRTLDESDLGKSA
jgi:hypothetical protein